MRSAGALGGKTLRGLFAMVLVVKLMSRFGTLVFVGYCVVLDCLVDRVWFGTGGIAS